jgi:uracil-DNA glycosylase
MTKEEYFGDWLKVLPLAEMQKVITRLSSIKDKICPEYKDIFKAFNKCSYKGLRVVILSQDPYPQKGIATGIAFANRTNTPEKLISPSLKIIKESVINYEVPHNLITFANDLEEWEKQGILMLNSALTCEFNNPGSHSLLWRPFISKLLVNICKNNSSIVFLLLGTTAQSFERYISNDQYVIKAKHPSYYYRNSEKMPYQIWHDINNILIGLNGYGINFYKEEKI